MLFNQLKMDENIRSSHAKRFVIEDSYTKVTADGEPHEMMTLIAGLSGVVAAIAILVVLISLVACKKDGGEANNCKNCPAGLPTNQCHQRRSRSQSKSNSNSQKTSISMISTGVTNVPSPIIMETVELGNGNLNGNLNAAFEGSELNLANNLKPKKKTRWYDEVIANGLAKETVIDMQER